MTAVIVVVIAFVVNGAMVAYSFRLTRRGGGFEE